MPRKTSSRRWSLGAAFIPLALFVSNYVGEKVLDHIGIGGWVADMMEFIQHPIGPQYSPYLYACLAGFFLGLLWGELADRYDEWRAERALREPRFRAALRRAAAAGIREPTDRARTGGRAAWMVHENAVALWLEHHDRIYLLPNLGNVDRKVGYIHDQSAPREFQDPQHVRQLLSLDDAFNPPRGGVAYAWYNRPEAVSWIGQFRSQKVVSGKDLTVQEFEKGVIVALGSGKDAAIVWAVEDGAWGSMRGAG